MKNLKLIIFVILLGTGVITSAIIANSHEKEMKQDNKIEIINNSIESKKATTQVEEVIPQSSDNKLKKLLINGKEYKVSSSIYYNTRQQSLEPLDIQAIPNDEKSTVKISGNRAVKAGDSNIVNITITAENGKKRTYDIKISTSNPIEEGVHTVDVYSALETDFYTNKDIITFNATARDISGYPLENSDPFTTFHATLYVEKDGSKRKLKDYTFNYQPYNTQIPASSVKTLLTDEDYVNGQATIVIEATVKTVAQGSFSGTSNIIIEE